jgi:acyl-CoA reductase-like NAD-dependent aldehyde dehydrogenase
MLLLSKMQRYSFTRLYANFYNGDFHQSKATKLYDIRNPVTQELVAQTPQSTVEEFNEVVASAKEGFKTWSKVPLMGTFIFYSSK